MLRVISLSCLFALFLACDKNSEPKMTTESAVNAQQAAKIILVTGVTGRQGGAVARALLENEYQVRGLSRNPQSDRALAMKARGVEMVKGDFEDIASLDAAMKDVHGVFSVTNFWEHGYEAEVQQGKNVIVLVVNKLTQIDT